jgi:diguanylate cyclase (GGDEF)-like protein
VLKYLPAAIPSTLGMFVLIGWFCDIEFLKRIDLRLVAMNPVTAVGMVLGGISLLVCHLSKHIPAVKGIGILFGALICIVALLKLFEITSGWVLGVDTWLFEAKLNIGSGPSNRMAPNTAINFLLIGIAIMLLHLRRGIVASQLSAAASALISVLAIVGYTYNISKFYGIGFFIPMAIHTATSFLLLAGAALYAEPDSGVMAIITNNGPAGRMARVLLPCAILIPIGFGWLGLIGQRAGLYQYELGTAVFVMANVFVFVVLIWLNTRQLFHADYRRQSAENKLRHSATHDSLTGLANRRLFIERLTHRMNLAKRRPALPFAVLFLDLDGFKQVNDKFGHGAGDSVLVEVSEILMKCSRVTDLVARLGGDEFSLLAEDMSHVDDARILADRILATMPTKYSSADMSVPIGISIGIAIYEHQHNADELMNDADKALYQAKKQGKGQYVIHVRAAAESKLARLCRTNGEHSSDSGHLAHSLANL